MIVTRSHSLRKPFKTDLHKTISKSLGWFSRYMTNRTLVSSRSKTCWISQKSTWTRMPKRSTIRSMSYRDRNQMENWLKRFALENFVKSCGRFKNRKMLRTSIILGSAASLNHLVHKSELKLCLEKAWGTVWIVLKKEGLQRKKN